MNWRTKVFFNISCVLVVWQRTSSQNSVFITAGKGKGKFHHRTGHEVPEGE
jgi:hypothetical protein